jgi:hypothetical protein
VLAVVIREGRCLIHQKTMIMLRIAGEAAEETEEDVHVSDKGS